MFIIPELPILSILLHYAGLPVNPRTVIAVIGVGRVIAVFNHLTRKKALNF